ncbi:MAG: 30S ribosomal protein S3, small subunit ribosomal protein S3 [Candidatus Peregrinibacteria bacterium GW2011_GWE2_39_6]|nr:MAG: 30S ribosomal protein S3, small subunit ribosomal protein S3 [Candidatus Peregrinibacteria bacterium GW2011_GWF2_39_17]KKR26539.1 MAG: 30S ribosomal protein S3, small subunit ribosomal protein S3 [Candidatus Peregrinibacteria bacterium GW2011_GWE2_39_6]
MGQKVNPKSLRIGIIRNWDSNWFANKHQYRTLLYRDIEIREYIKKYFQEGFISKVEILRDANKTNLVIHTSRPGVIIGRQGEGIEKFQEALGKKFHGQKFEVTIKEIKNPDLDAYIVAENIGKQISRRVSYRRAVKTAIQRAMENGAKGIKIIVKGRLNGVEIARSETVTEGKIPLHTFRADIDYAYYPAQTTYGVIGVKIWIFKGEIFNKITEMVSEETKSGTSR